MANDICDCQKKVYEAWKSARARESVRTFPPNPRHDRGGLPISRGHESSGVDIDAHDLACELKAWEEASDEDYEKFEQSLE